jgi:hypothetical protein
MSITEIIVENKKQLILLAVWFGELPPYFDLWMYTLQNKKYDILFISDQTITNYPKNMKIIYMTMEIFNNCLNEKTGYNIRIKHVSKLVDVKPLLGYLFSEFITCYHYWGWTDIDMMMGDILSEINENENENEKDDYDVYSYGYKSFGPLMIFKREFIDIFKHLENYEDILNDEIICKVDEPWWFINNKNTVHLQIYTDQKTRVKYYSGKNILDYVNNKKVYVSTWKNICIGIDWNIDKTTCYKKEDRWNYVIYNNKLYKDSIEIKFSHLTLLKNNKQFLNFINKKITNKQYCCFTVIFKYNYPYENSLNVYDTYDKYVNISFE